MSSDWKPFGPKRKYSVSIAVPGSIVDNAQTEELKAYLIGQVARAAAMFNVDEIIVFSDTNEYTDGCLQMCKVLQYLECPQYLRKSLFSLMPELKFAGVVSPMNLPHHLAKDEVLPYREGVMTGKPCKGEGGYANVGLEKDVRVNIALQEGIRVTVKLDNPEAVLNKKNKGQLRGTVVSPTLPREEAGLYWGYTVRLAESFSAVFKTPKEDQPYDVKIGTSDKGVPVKDIRLAKSFKRLLIAFGGVNGLEYACVNDIGSQKSLDDHFDFYVNTCANQGTKTIRTEEAILVSLAALAPHIEKAQPKL